MRDSPDKSAAAISIAAIGMAANAAIALVLLLLLSPILLFGFINLSKMVRNLMISVYDGKVEAE